MKPHSETRLPLPWPSINIKMKIYIFGDSYESPYCSGEGGRFMFIFDFFSVSASIFYENGKSGGSRVASARE